MWSSKSAAVVAQFLLVGVAPYSFPCRWSLLRRLLCLRLLRLSSRAPGSLGRGFPVGVGGHPGRGGLQPQVQAEQAAGDLHAHARPRYRRSSQRLDRECYGEWVSGSVFSCVLASAREMRANAGCCYRVAFLPACLPACLVIADVPVCQIPSEPSMSIRINTAAALRSP